MTIGAAMPRREDARLLAGGGRYVADVPLPGALHAVFVRSTHPHARIVAVDAGEARAMPGVVAVLVAGDLPAATLWNARHPGLLPTPQPILAVERVRFVGEAVAVVVAADRYLAEDAADVVEVDYEPLPHTVRADIDPAPGALLFDDLEGNVVFESRRMFGDPVGALADAAHVVTRELHFSRQSAMPLEARGCAAAFDRFAGRLDVWASTQAPHVLRRKLAPVVGLGEHQILVHFHDVGGAFGQKIPLHTEDAVVALAAMALDAPVRWTEDRRENLLAAPHAREQHVRMTIGADADGRLVAVDATIVGDAGAYSFNAASVLTEPYLTARSLLGAYRIEHYGYHVTARLTNKSPIAPYRGVGYVNAQAIRELAIDDLARLSGIDAVELRRRNLVSAAEMPYRSAVGMRFDSASHHACLEAVTERLSPGAVAERAAADGRGRRWGVGVSSYVEPTGPGSRLVEEVWETPSNESDTVRVRLDPSGTVTVSFGTPSLGQGIETTMIQVVADVLSCAVDDVAVVLGDTSSAPLSMTGTRGSRAAVITGGAAARAAGIVRDELQRVAAVLLEAAVDDIVIASRAVHVRGVESAGIPITRVVQAGLTSHEVRAEAGEVTFDAASTFDPTGGAYANGCIGVAVSVDPVTGEVTVEEAVAAHDCGTVINPAIVDGQLVGGMVQGLGQALFERIDYGDDGQPLTSTLLDYLVPTASEAFDVSIVHFESPSPHTWRGIKGAGEGGPIGMTAAVVCAVADACGDRADRITELPLRPSVLSDVFADDEPGPGADVRA